MMGARGNVGATANLDSPCARQRLGIVGRGEETSSRSNKETDEEKDAPLRRGLTKKAPYKWVKMFLAAIMFMTRCLSSGDSHSMLSYAASATFSHQSLLGA
jgi:hypothetical protein